MGAVRDSIGSGSRRLRKLLRRQASHEGPEKPGPSHLPDAECPLVQGHIRARALVDERAVRQPHLPAHPVRLVPYRQRNGLRGDKAIGRSVPRRIRSQVQSTQSWWLLSCRSQDLPDARAGIPGRSYSVARPSTSGLIHEGLVRWDETSSTNPSSSGALPTATSGRCFGVIEPVTDASVSNRSAPAAATNAHARLMPSPPLVSRATHA